MPTLLRMPEVAANATEAVLQEWVVEEQACFDAEQPLATVETEKAVVDIEAEGAGVMLRHLVGSGTRVAVGAPIALVGSAADASVDVDSVLASMGVAPGAPEAAPEAQAQERTPAEPTDPEGGTAATSSPSPPARPPAPPAPSSRPASGADTADGSRRIFASPLARRLAAEAGIALSDIEGSGPRGRVTRRDVDNAVATRASAGDARRVEHSRMRRAIAGRLTRSKQEVPHFYLRQTVRADGLRSLRAELNGMESLQVSLNDLVVKAVGRAHRLVPRMNVTWEEDALLHHADVDVALAVATDDGLVTPVLRGVDRLAVGELAAEARSLAEKARAGSLRQRELDGGSLTVTNLGMYGVEEFAAIINPPQAAILAVGALRRDVTAGESGPEVADVMTLTLSVDHRAVDGAHAAEWMAALRDLLEHPVRILA